MHRAAEHLARVGAEPAVRAQLPRPAYQEKQVLLHQYDTPAAEVIEALLEGASADAELALVELNTSRDIAKVHDAPLKALELLTILSDRCRDCVGPLR